jgi:hypothetical protein
MKTTNKYWPFIRIALFIIIGLMNTVFIRPEDIGTWKNYVGYALLLLGLIDSLILFRKILSKRDDKS